MSRCRTLEAPPSIISLWQTERPKENRPGGDDDVKAICAKCGREGWAYMTQGDIDDIGPSRFECVFGCSEGAETEAAALDTTRPLVRTPPSKYVCTADDCGFIFVFSDQGYRQPSPPRFCPCCGMEDSTVVFEDDQKEIPATA